MTDLPPQRPDGLSEAEHPLWQVDRKVFNTVGIDIGSATTHFTFSTITLRRRSGALSSRFVVTDRQIQHCSEILPTPFFQNRLIDRESISLALRTAMSEAGVSPGELATGAVITTGDAARKRNAAVLVDLIAEEAGKFVSAAAGPVLEARLAAHGSGAVARSIQVPDATVLNVDIGGGTTKITWIKGGEIQAVTALNVGARLLTFDAEKRIDKAEAAAVTVADSLGFAIPLGAQIDPTDVAKMVSALGDAVLTVCAGQPSKVAERLLILPPLPQQTDADIVVFSGGVSEYIYNHERRYFGDLGIDLGARIRSRVSEIMPRVIVEAPSYGIRATVVGASQFSVQVSGNTTFIGSQKLLPQRNIPVVPVVIVPTCETPATIAATFERALTTTDILSCSTLALAIKWPFGPSYEDIERLCAGLKKAISELKLESLPLFIILDVDIAMTVGTHLAKILGHLRIVCLDGVELEALDYIDVSGEDPIAKVVTVTVKSLVFTG